MIWVVLILLWIDYITFNQKLDEKTQKVFYNTALTCPVAKSIHPDIIQKVTISSKSY